jgi:hypothetical protein
MVTRQGARQRRSADYRVGKSCMRKSFTHAWIFLWLSPIATLTVYSDVCTKYQEAAKIVNLALQGLVSQCVPGGTILDICEFGQTIITTQSAKLYTKKVNGQVVDRGVAFPVCISVNDIVCNHSPLPNEERVSAVPCGIEKNGVPAVQNNLWWSTQVCHDCLPTVSLKTIPFISSPLSTERRRKGGL